METPNPVLPGQTVDVAAHRLGRDIEMRGQVVDGHETATVDQLDNQFLTRLPVKSLPAARLEVQTPVVNLATLKIGMKGQFKLQLHNRGSRIIYGSISSDCPWLAPSDTGKARTFQFFIRDL